MTSSDGRGSGPGGATDTLASATLCILHADSFGLRIMVLTSFTEQSVIKIDPSRKQSERVLWLSFWAEVHYNSIYPKEQAADLQRILQRKSPGETGMRDKISTSVGGGKKR